jgi:long-chain fatty acid transport protein
MTFKSGILAACAMALMTSAAFAGGFSIREQSTEAQGTSFAGAAAGTEGLSAMFWNPATLSNNNDKGLISENNAALILPDVSADNGVGGGAGAGGGARSGNIGKLSLVPAGYWSYGLTEDLTLGFGMNAPIGLTTEADLWAGSPHSDHSAARTYNFNPAAAYRVGDWLTLGLGVQVEYMTVDINSRLPNGVEIFRTEGNSIGVGMTAGVLLEPTATTDIGIGFRSAVKHQLEGDGFRLAPAYSGGVGAEFTAPEIITIGLQQALSDDLRLKAGVEWTNWSRFKELAVTRDDTGAVFARTSQNYKDGWFYSVGAEYDVSEILTVRAGVAYEKSPVQDAFRTPRTPDNDRLWLSAGASYQIAEAWKAHMAYSFVKIKDAPINLAIEGPPGTPASLTADFKGHLNIISVSLTRDW